MYWVVFNLSSTDLLRAELDKCMLASISIYKSNVDVYVLTYD